MARYCGVANRGGRTVALASITVTVEETLCSIRDTTIVLVTLELHLVLLCSRGSHYRRSIPRETQTPCGV